MADWLEGQDYSRGVLESTLSDTAVVIQLAGDRTADFPAAPFILTLFDAAAYRSPVEASEAGALEKVLVTEIALTTDTRFTITRAYDGTLAREWPAGTAIWVAVNWAVFDQLQSAITQHNHSGGDALAGASALRPENVAATDYITAASYMTAATYLQVGSYLKGYNDASALYGGATGGVLELTQGAPSGATARSKVLMWCRDGIAGGAQVGFGPVHASTNAYLRFVLFPKGTPADGAGFTIFGDGAATRWANFYATTTDAGVAVQSGITTYSWRNSHLTAGTLALQLDLANSLLTFRGDAIVGRSAANEITVGTVAAPDNLVVTGNLSVTGTVTNTALNGAINASMLPAREFLVEKLLALAGTASNVKGLWIFDPTSGTSMTDYSGQGHTATLSANASAMTPTVSGLKRSLRCSASALWSAGDDDDFSVNGPTACTMIWFGRLQDATASTLMAKYNNTTGSVALEYLWMMDDSDKMRVRFHSKNLIGTYIGRSYNTALTADQNTWKCYACTYDGGTASSGVKLYRDAVQIDDTNQTAGTFVDMNNTAAPLAGYGRTADGSMINPCKGDIMLSMIIRGETWSTTQLARVCLLLNNVAATGVGQA